MIHFSDQILHLLLSNNFQNVLYFAHFLSLISHLNFFMTDLAMMVVVVPVTNYSSILNLKQLVSNLIQFCYMTLDVTSH